MNNDKTNQTFSSIKKQIDELSLSPNSVAVLAVSKKQSEDKIKFFYDQGVRLFGENYLQEFLDKKDKLNHLKIEWHFIGSLQSNKLKLIAENFSFVQTVDQIKHIGLLQKHALELNKSLNILLQVNVGGELSKGGIEPTQINLFIDEVLSCSNLKLRGIMVFPPPGGEEKWFKLSKQIFDEVQNKLDQSFNVLSLGTSDDYKVAIKYGSTMVRLGTVLFGPRG